MGFFDKFLKKKEEQVIENNHDFWAWFKSNERAFYEVIKEKGNVEEEFLNLLSPKLNQLRAGYYFLAGMANEYMAELVISADGVVENIPFVEDLVHDAPHLPGWKITALKPALEIEDVSINMAGFEFNKDNLHFHVNEDPRFPDEIDLSIIYEDYKEDDKAIITNGVFVFLDNFLGELRTVTAIDVIEIAGPTSTANEPIPIAKLKDYLNWREKEFVEKYKGTRHNTDNDNYASLTAELENGKPLIAVINTDLLEWDRKASHPWVLVTTIKYEGNDKGMPDDDTYQILNALEDEIMKELKDFEGYLNIGRQTCDNEREIYFACKDFRKPSRLLDRLKQEHTENSEIKFEIYKDKYWRTFNRFQPDI